MKDLLLCRSGCESFLVLLAIVALLQLYSLLSFDGACGHAGDYLFVKYNVQDDHGYRSHCQPRCHGYPVGVKFRHEVEQSHWQRLGLPAVEEHQSEEIFIPTVDKLEDKIDCQYGPYQRQDEEEEDAYL